MNLAITYEGCMGCFWGEYNHLARLDRRNCLNLIIEKDVIISIIELAYRLCAGVTRLDAKLLSCGKRRGSGDRSPIRFCLKDINTPGRDRTHQASSRKTSLRLQE